jgi:hypothetical protein
LGVLFEVEESTLKTFKTFQKIVKKEIGKNKIKVHRFDMEKITLHMPSLTCA